ncbi:unnamed protein product [Caenorhabditis sp. 36 PRJEB53466]|nr:unnamed protein product [Caenorhabditis sp. 36 PRJEB53466]
MGHDIHASITYIRRVSLKMIMLTGTVVCLVVYIYLRRLLSNERLIHQAELFRHNWCVETEQKEKRLEINEKNRLFDTSLLEENIDDPSDPNSAGSPHLTNTDDADGDEELLGLLPRDKLAAFPNPIRMRVGCYILLIITMILIWLLLLCEYTFSTTGQNSRRVLSDDNFSFARLLEILKAHNRVMDVKAGQSGYQWMHKCFGQMEDLKSALSSSVMTTIKVFVWERSLGASIVPISVPILSLALLMDLAIQGVYFSRMDHKTKETNGKTYIYLYNVSYQFLLSFFVFTIFSASSLMAEQYFSRPDRHVICPGDERYCTK